MHTIIAEGETRILKVHVVDFVWSYSGSFRRSQWKHKQVRTDPTCVYCSNRVGVGKAYGWLEATVDHVQALARGGREIESNYALACRACNQSKGSGKFCPDKRRALILQRADPNA